MRIVLQPPKQGATPSKPYAPGKQQNEPAANNISPTPNPPFSRKRSEAPKITLLSWDSQMAHVRDRLSFAAKESGEGSPPTAGSLRYIRPTEASRRYIAAARHKAAALGETDTCKNITWQGGAVCRESKQALLGQKGCVIWFTGLSGSGKSTVAITLEHALAAHGRLTTLLDGDNIRHGLNSNLGFSPEDREENIRRIGEVSKLMMESGVMTLASFISPYQKDRDLVRERIPRGEFIEVHMNVPLEVCEARDPKGLYKLARSGKIKCFTGIDDPYEAPTHPEIVLEHLRPDGSPNTPDDMAATIVDYLKEKGFLQDTTHDSGPACNGRSD